MPSQCRQRRGLSDALRTQQAQVWAYEFEWDDLPKTFDKIFGAAHTFDLPFIFGNFGLSLYARISFTKANEPGRLAQVGMGREGRAAARALRTAGQAGLPYATAPVD